MLSTLEKIVLAGAVLLSFAVTLFAVRLIAGYLCTHGWLQ